MARVMAARKLNRHLSRDVVVQRALEKQAKKMSRVAEGILAAHKARARAEALTSQWAFLGYDSGDHKIEVERLPTEKYGIIDVFLSLKGRAPISLEFGHWVKDSKGKKVKYVRGARILQQTLASAR